MVIIREETPQDIDRIREINDAAFSQPNEGRIVDQIRKSCSETLSLVGVLDGKIIGHILFSPVEIETQTGIIKGMGLAPMAVAPDQQNQGIGIQLVVEGLKIIKKRGYPFVIVLGHPNYYPRFGFKPVSLYGLKCQWEGVPAMAFMAIIFDEEKMIGVTGVTRYRDEFNDAM
ncbi:MAG: N-acetyltransferase [Pelolinea sp.]|nr:N-acetyltransferase [Pelolinea sp.]